MKGNFIKCLGDTVDIKAYVDGVYNDPNYTYQWYHSDILVPTYIPYTVAEGGNTANLIITNGIPNNLDFVHLVATDINGTCKDTISDIGFLFLPPYSDTTIATSCDSYTWYNTTYTTSGQYVVLTPDTVFGACDTTHVLNLTIFNTPNIVTTLNHPSGNYCLLDSIHVNSTVDGVLNPTSGYTYQWLIAPTSGGTYGNYFFTTPNINGIADAVDNYYFAIEVSNGICKDTSFFTINIPGAYANRDTLNINTCNAYTWTNGLTYTNSGFYTQNFTNVGGCDSIKVLNYRQQQLVCDTMSINISTGIDLVGNTLAGCFPDPNWTEGITNKTLFLAPFFAGFWQPTPMATTNAGWINHSCVINGANNLYNSTVPFTIQRNFTIPTSGGIIIPNFGITADDAIVSVEIENPSGVIYPLIIPASPAYHIAANVTSAGIIPAAAGVWKIRAQALFIDQTNAFLLSGYMQQITCDTVCCAPCIADSIVLNTGINNDLNLIPIAAVDPHWVVTSYTGVPSAIVPTEVITPIVSWYNGNPLEARYILASGLFNFSLAAFTYERKFKVCEAGNFLINLTSQADNYDSIYVDGTYITATTTGTSGLLYGFYLNNTAVATNVPIYLTAGIHSVIAKVYNVAYSPTAFLLHGSIKPALNAGGTLAKDSCIIFTLPLGINNIVLQTQLQNEVSTLNWTLQNKNELQNMVIQKSVDGNNFYTINEMPVLNKNTYTYNDVLNAADCNHTIYYRINAEAKNQEHVFSNVTNVLCKPNADVSVYPNPAKDYLTVTTNLKIEKVALYNMQSQLVQEWPYSNSNNYKLQNVAAGIYVVKINTKQKTFTERLIVQ